MVVSCDQRLSMKKILFFFLFACTFRIVAAAQSLPSLIPYLDGHEWGYADTNGHVVIKPQWRYAGFFKNGRADVYKEDSHCLIDMHGAYIIPPTGIGTANCTPR